MPSGTIKAPKYKIGIVGAGSSGLFTRLIFDHLKELYGLDVEYEILEANDNNRLGGRLYTDYFDDPAKNNLIRNCVYPSYNIDDPIDKPGVLLASYTWSQEGQRIALLIDNLAQLHSSSKAEYDEDWYADPGTTSAFAYFDHGQFRNMYPYIVRNDGTHIIIGEALSADHVWVVGALESTVRGVYQFLYHQSKRDAKVNKVLQAYNHNKVRAPYRPVLAEPTVPRM
ncbi:MAG: hypothetical protein Q9197_001886 [Variospora fuerteventurae]